MTIAILRRRAGTAFMGDFPNLGTYVARGEAGLAFVRGFDARLARFMASKAGGYSDAWRGGGGVSQRRPIGRCNSAAFKSAHCLEVLKSNHAPAIAQDR